MPMKSPFFDGDGLRCSFCGKSRPQAWKLISSPSGDRRSYICDECVGVCSFTLEEEKQIDPPLVLSGRTPTLAEVKEQVDQCFTGSEAE